jgi:hypothetical protein
MYRDKTAIFAVLALSEIKDSLIIRTCFLPRQSQKRLTGNCGVRGVDIRSGGMKRVVQRKELLRF